MTNGELYNACFLPSGEARSVSQKRLEAVGGRTNLYILEKRNISVDFARTRTTALHSAVCSVNQPHCSVSLLCLKLTKLRDVTPLPASRIGLLLYAKEVGFAPDGDQRMLKASF